MNNQSSGWFRRRLGVLIACGAIILAVAVGGAGFWIGRMSGSVDEMRNNTPNEIAVFLCNGIASSGYPNCRSGSVTKEQQAVILGALRSLPAGSKVRFVTHDEAYSDLRKKIPQVAKHTLPSDLPESYRLPYTGKEDLSRMRVAVGGLSGVQEIVPQYPKGSCIRT